jgi:hypothetical protein
MDAFELPPQKFPDDVDTYLFVSWVQYFSRERLSLEQHGSSGKVSTGIKFTFGSPTDSHFILERSNKGIWTVAKNVDVNPSVLADIVDEAISRLSSGDLGDGVVYQTTLKSKGFSMSAGDLSQFMRRLGDQVPITGMRRLGDYVIIEFSQEPPADPNAPLLFVPETSIKVTVFAPGPIASTLTHRTASGTFEIVAAICAFALGNPIETPIVAMPSPADAADPQRAIRHDASTLGLARDSVSLDIFGEFLLLGGPQAVLKVRGALLAYNAALQQSSSDVALMLLVSSIEALIVPSQDWKKDKATKRFIEAVNELCPEVVDTLVSHGNVEEAFDCKIRGGEIQRRKRLLDRIYEFRSIPTHQGLGLSTSEAFIALASPGSMRVALLSDLARGAILNYLRSPRSSLIGHPSFAGLEILEPGPDVET